VILPVFNKQLFVEVNGWSSTLRTQVLRLRLCWRIIAKRRKLNKAVPKHYSISCWSITTCMNTFDVRRFEVLCSRDFCVRTSIQGFSSNAVKRRKFNRTLPGETLCKLSYWSGTKNARWLGYLKVGGRGIRALKGHAQGPLRQDRTFDLW